MSRSFVRAWATVATIMAMVCLAFVQPMPEHVSTSAPQALKAAAFATSPESQISETAPFVDSITTGKTFTPYVTLRGWDLLRDPVSRRLMVVATIDWPLPPPLDPPARPG
jgi:hypothetical protein